MPPMSSPRPVILLKGRVDGISILLHGPPFHFARRDEESRIDPREKSIFESRTLKGERRQLKWVRLRLCSWNGSESIDKKISALTHALCNSDFNIQSRGSAACTRLLAKKVRVFLCTCTYVFATASRYRAGTCRLAAGSFDGLITFCFEMWCIRVIKGS